MPSILAIVSKKIFERDFRGSLGDVVPTTTYASTHASLDKMEDGGDLFLVTVAPGEQLWLVGVLVAPTKSKSGWSAKANTTPITDISSLIPQLQFENGKGLSAKAGALAMSLQTPRTLADSDVELLRATAGAKKSAAKTSPPAASAKTSTAKASAAKLSIAKTSAAKSTAKAPEQPAAKPSAANAAKTSAAAPAPKASAAKPVSGDPLIAAGELLAQGAYGRALGELLKAWERCKAAEIADLIDQLGDWIDEGLPKIEGKRTAIDGAWRDVGDQLRPADVGRLTMALELGTAKQVEGWLEVLDRFPADPRLCRSAIAISTKFVASSAGPTRTRAFRLAEKIADGRCIEQIQKLIKQQSGAWNTQELKDRLRKAMAKFAAPPALPATDKAAVVALGKTLAKLVEQPPPDESTLADVKSTGGGDAERLLAEVLADPDNDAPRLVYADHLQEEGDPRGELITLQLQPTRTPAQDKRIAELLKNKANITKWLGPLVAIVQEPVFERGFLACCRVVIKTPKQRELLAHPLWGTVREVETTDLAVVESPAMRSLRTVRGLPIPAVAQLATHPSPPPIEELAGLVYDTQGDDDDTKLHVAAWQQLIAHGKLAKLRALGIAPAWDTTAAIGAEPAGYKWLLDSRLGTSLERLTIDFGNGDFTLAPWLPVFASHPKLQRIELEREGHMRGTTAQRFTVAASRGGKQFRIEIRVWDWFLDGPKFERELATRVFDGFPNAAAPDLEITVGSKATQKQLATLETTAKEVLSKQFTSIALVRS